MVKSIPPMGFARAGRNKAATSQAAPIAKTSCSPCWICCTVDAGFGTTEDIFVRLKPKTDALDVDELDIGHAEEAEHRAQIGDSVIKLHGSTLGIDAAGSAAAIP